MTWLVIRTPFGFPLVIRGAEDNPNRPSAATRASAEFCRDSGRMRARLCMPAVMARAVQRAASAAKNSTASRIAGSKYPADE